MSLTTQAGFLATARLGGEDHTFQSFDGGGVTAESNPDRAPGQRFASQVGGLPSLEPIELGRTFDWARDTDTLYSQWRGLVGVPDQAIVTLWSLDANLQPYRKIGTWTGMVSDVPNPATDSNSSDKAECRITVVPSGVN